MTQSLVGIEVMVVCGAVEQATAIQLILQINPGLVAHHVPRGGQQLLLQSTNNSTGSTTLIQQMQREKPSSYSSSLLTQHFKRHCVSGISSYE